MDLKQRLSAMIENDKKDNPKYLIDVIKSDFFYLINNYFEVAFDDIKVEINADKNDYAISILCVGERIKLMHTLPGWCTKITQKAIP